MAKDDKDLPNVGALKRTGVIGEIMTDDRRKREMKANKKELESSRNKPAGTVERFVNTDRYLSDSSQRKAFKEQEKEKEKTKAEARKRIEELKIRR